MNPIPDHVQRLRQLDELEKARKALTATSAKRAAMNAKIEAVRQLLPTAILIYYDQRLAHHRPALAAVERGICCGCHISMSRGSVAALRRGGGSLQVCENCGAFIYMDENERRGSNVTAR